MSLRAGSPHLVVWLGCDAPAHALVADGRKRAIIEIIYDQLKSICQIEHSRHRSPVNFLVNLGAGPAAYSHQPTQPALELELYRFAPL